MHRRRLKPRLVLAQGKNLGTALGGKPLSLVGLERIFHK